MLFCRSGVMPPCTDFPRRRENVNILHGGGDAFFAIMGDRPKGPPHAAEKGVIVLVLAPLFPNSGYAWESNLSSAGSAGWDLP